MGPVGDRRAIGDRNKQLVRGTAVRHLNVSVSLLTFSSILHVTAPTTQDGGRLLVGDLGIEFGSNRRDRTAGFFHFVPGR